MHFRIEGTGVQKGLGTLVEEAVRRAVLSMYLVLYVCMYLAPLGFCSFLSITFWEV